MNKYTLLAIFHPFVDLFKQSVPDNFSEYAELSMFTLGNEILVMEGFKVPNVQLVLDTLRAERQKVNAMMADINARLDKIEKGELSPNQPYVSFKPIHDIKDLRSPHRSLKEALLHDLGLLRQQLQQIKEEQRLARKQQFHQRVIHARKKLDEYIEQMIRDNEINATELDEFQQLSDNLLSMQTQELKGNPSIHNMKNVLHTVTLSQLMGTDLNSGKCEEAFGALAAASEQRYNRTEKQFRQKPNSNNLRKLYDEEALTQLLGGTINRHASGFVPAGNITHVIASGDTLSDLSKKYYGSFNYWDVIYENNIEQIGDRYDNLPIGITLIIP